MLLARRAVRRVHDAAAMQLVSLTVVAALAACSSVHADARAADVAVQVQAPSSYAIAGRFKHSRQHDICTFARREAPGAASYRLDCFEYAGPALGLVRIGAGEVGGPLSTVLPLDPHGFTIADVDGDGHDEVLVHRRDGGALLFRFDPSRGTFVEDARLDLFPTRAAAGR
jgi:hypothetical protein